MGNQPHPWRMITGTLTVISMGFSAATTEQLEMISINATSAAMVQKGLLKVMSGMITTVTASLLKCSVAQLSLELAVTTVNSVAIPVNALMMDGPMMITFVMPNCNGWQL